MATYNFDLLDLLDGESGEAAVSIIVGKKKAAAAAAAAAAKPADPAEQAAKEKAKYSYDRLKHDEGVRIAQKELRRLKDVMRKLRGEEANLMEQPGNDEHRLQELSKEQEKLSKENSKLKQEEAKLVRQRKTFYRDHEIPLPEYKKPNIKGGNADSGSNRGNVNGNAYNNNDGGSSGYPDHGERKLSSYAGSEPEHKGSGIEAGANADNAVPASESEKFAGGAAQDGPRNGQGASTGTNIPFQKKGTVNGSEKRKKKNAKKNSGNEPKKQDSKVDGSKNQADQQPMPVYLKEEGKKTLAEYEKMCGEKKKSSEASKPETRKVDAEEFEGMKMLEKKKLDEEEAAIKVEKAQPKVKEAAKKDKKVQTKEEEAAAKDGKPKKVVVPRQILGFTQPRRVTQEDVSLGRGRFNGGFQGGSSDKSTEPQVNSRAVANEGTGGAPRGEYNRGNGRYGHGKGNGYQGNGGNQQHQQQQGGLERAGYGGCNSGEAGHVPEVKLDMSLFPALPTARSAAAAPAQASSAPAPATAA